MQTFIDTMTQKIWAFDDDVMATVTDGVYSFQAASGMELSVPSTLQPYALPAPTPEQIAAQQWVAYQAPAMAALTESDKTILRCAENSVTVPAEWSAYRKALRAIVGATTGDPTQPLPVRPAYPAGT